MKAKLLFGAILGFGLVSFANAQNRGDRALYVETQASGISPTSNFRSGSISPERLALRAFERRRLQDVRAEILDGFNRLRSVYLHPTFGINRSIIQESIQRGLVGPRLPDFRYESSFTRTRSPSAINEVHPLYAWKILADIENIQCNGLDPIWQGTGAVSDGLSDGITPACQARGGWIVRGASEMLDSITPTSARSMLYNWLTRTPWVAVCVWKKRARNFLEQRCFRINLEDFVERANQGLPVATDQDILVQWGHQEI